MIMRNYTSWNIITNQLTLDYTRGVANYNLKCQLCLHVPMGETIRDSTLCEGLGAILPLPIKWPRLTGAIGAGLQRRYIICGAWHHMKPIPDEMSIKQNSCWNLYQIKYYLKPVWDTTYT